MAEVENEELLDYDEEDQTTETQAGKKKTNSLKCIRGAWQNDTSFCREKDTSVCREATNFVV